MIPQEKLKEIETTVGIQHILGRDVLWLIARVKELENALATEHSPAQREKHKDYAGSCSSCVALGIDKGSK